MFLHITMIAQRIVKEYPRQSRCMEIVIFSPTEKIISKHYFLFYMIWLTLIERSLYCHQLRHKNSMKELLQKRNIRYIIWYPVGIIIPQPF